MLKPKYLILIRTVIRFLSVLLLLAGCTSPYTVLPSKTPAYPGEVNQHVRWIQAGSQRIYQILTSPQGMKSLCPDGTVVSYLSPSPYVAGNLVETRVEHIFKLKWISRVEQVVANQSIRLTFRDGFFSGGTELWEFHPETNGTRVSHSIFIEPKGFFKRLAWVTKVRRKHDKMVELFLDNLKQTAESAVMWVEQNGAGNTSVKQP
jgi:ribosome-associated toxin RatA of RatAB toxin-antitoxin module